MYIFLFSLFSYRGQEFRFTCDLFFGKAVDGIRSLSPPALFTHEHELLPGKNELLFEYLSNPSDVPDLRLKNLICGLASGLITAELRDISPDLCPQPRGIFAGVEHNLEWAYCPDCKDHRGDVSEPCELDLHDEDAIAACRKRYIDLNVHNVVKTMISRKQPAYERENFKETKEAMYETEYERKVSRAEEVATLIEEARTGVVGVGHRIRAIFASPEAQIKISKKSIQLRKNASERDRGFAASGGGAVAELTARLETTDLGVRGEAAAEPWVRSYASEKYRDCQNIEVVSGLKFDKGQRDARGKPYGRGYKLEFDWCILQKQGDDTYILKDMFEAKNAGGNVARLLSVDAPKLVSSMTMMASTTTKWKTGDGTIYHILQDGIPAAGLHYAVFSRITENSRLETKDLIDEDTFFADALAREIREGEVSGCRFENEKAVVPPFNIAPEVEAGGLIEKYIEHFERE